MSDLMHEEALLRLTGLSADRLRRIRADHLFQDEHWVKARGHVNYTAEGVQAVMGLLDVRTQAGSTPLATTATGTIGHDPQRSEAVVGHPVNLMIYKVCPNPTWVRCMAPDGRKVDCRVQNNRHLHPMQTLKDCREQADGRFIYYGRCVL